MKKLALISTYCNTDEKIQVLKENLLEFKKLNVDTLILSPLLLDDEVIKLSTYCFFTKENPVLKWPERANTFWYSNLNAKGEYVEMHRDIDDYGWAAVYQMKKLSDIGLTMNYDIFYHVIYDLEITENIINDIQSNCVNKTYHRINPKHTKTQWDVTLHFMILDKEKLSLLSQSINKADYIHLNGFAEEYIKTKVEVLSMDKSEFDVKDKIRYIDADDNNIFNYSKSSEYKVFFGKWDYMLEDMGDDVWIVVYDIIENKNVKIILDDNIEIDMIHLTPIKIKTNFSKIEIVTQETRIDYTQILEDVSRNVIKYDKNFKKND
jgi:hypothetical protein